MTALRFRDVGFRYPGAARPALEALAFALAPGEAAGVFGANGAGKSTLLRLAMALLHPTAGTVEVLGEATDGRAPEDLAGPVALAFQQPEAQLFATTVRAELAFGPAQLGWPPARIAARSTEVLARLGLEEVAERHPYDLPLPQRRLVALGTALVTGPRLLLLDEPTAGLDRAHRALVATVVREACADGAAVLAVTHDPAFAAEALDRALTLDGGRLVADEPAERWLRDGSAGALPPPPAILVARGLGLPAGIRRESAIADLVASRLLGGS